MRRESARGNKPKKGKSAPATQPPQDAPERARDLLLRLETGGPNPVNAAEELDRLQGRLERDGTLELFREHVAELADAWSETALRGERGRAWLTLVGAYDLKEHTLLVANLALDPGLPGPLRSQACHVLARLGGETASGALQQVLLSGGDAQVRAASAESLGLLRDRSVRPVLETLLEEDLPRNVWNAVSEAADRLR
ncbi:MAG: HEAT repeat domain-containing protein [Armatimonadota bacterium]